MKLFKSIPLLPFVLALLHVLVLTYFDKSTFNVEFKDVNLVFIVLKIVVFFALFFCWNYICRLFCSVVLQRQPLPKKVKIFLIYFSISLVFYVIFWPGIWIWDEFGVYQYAIDRNYFYWQNYFTSIYFMLGLMFFPFAAGIVFFQLLLISLIVTFILHDLSKVTKYYWLGFILFFLPPIVYHNFDPIRISLYAYLLLFVVYYLSVYLKNKNQLVFKDFLPVVLLVPIIAIWRAEGIIFLPCIVAYIFFFLYKKSAKKNTWIALLLMLVFTICLNNPQKIWATHNRDYALTAMLNPLSMMLQQQNELKNFKKLKPALSRGINLEVLARYPEFKETPAYWAKRDSLVVGKNNEDFDAFRNGFVQLVIANPTVFLHARWQTFWYTSACINDDFRRTRTADFDLNKRDDYVIQLFRDHRRLNKVYFPKTRSAVVNFIEGSDQVNKKQATWVYFITWNLMLVAIALIFLTVISLLKRNWSLLVICLMLWTASAAIFLTAPAAYFMYYFPIYLVVSVLLLNCVFRFIEINRNNI